MFKLLKGMRESRKTRKAEKTSEEAKKVKYTELDVRLGGRIDIDPTKFLTFANSTLEPDASYTVEAVATLNMFGVPIERVILNDGSFIQIFKDDVEVEYMFFQLTMEEHPQSEEEWWEYTGIEGLMYDDQCKDEKGNEFFAMWNGPAQTVISYRNLECEYTEDNLQNMFGRKLEAHGSKDVQEFLMFQVEEGKDYTRMCGYGGIIIEPRDLTIYQEKRIC